jgi:hypothetical protein
LHDIYVWLGLKGSTGPQSSPALPAKTYIKCRGLFTKVTALYLNPNPRLYVLYSKCNLKRNKYGREQMVLFFQKGDGSGGDRGSVAAFYLSVDFPIVA